MPVAEYKVIIGNGRQVNEQLVQEGKKGWKPILMSTTVTGGQAPVVQVAIVLEHLPGAGTPEKEIPTA